MPGKLSIVATPIGNLEDITLRALRVLSEADIIACEDTRMTKRILDRYEISTKTISYHAHSADSKSNQIIEMLEGGMHVALVSDAGTPAISDPGASLVRDVINYNKINTEVPITIEAIPGASALTTAYSISGIERTGFTFLGFSPHKKGRQTFFKNIEERINNNEIVIFYESVHRFLKTLDSLHDNVPTATVTVVRELTKIHEQVVEGTPEELIELFEDNPETQKGEFVIIVREAEL